MSAQYDPDPPVKWRRKNFDPSKVRNLNRETFEIEVARDLAKPLEQLVCDVHEESHDNNRTELRNIAGAQKRMVSMMARVAKTNDRAANWMLLLTLVIVVLTAVIFWLTYLMYQQSKTPSHSVPTAATSSAAGG